MMRTAYRITKTLHVHYLSCLGTARFCVRWNTKGTYLLYTASLAALAMLEWLTHAIERLMDESYSLVTILLPNQSIEKLAMSALPLNWQKVPPPAALAYYGRRVVANGKFLALKVPSVLVPHNYTLVVYSQHRLLKQVKIEILDEIYPEKRIDNQANLIEESIFLFFNRNLWGSFFLD